MKVLFVTISFQTLIMIDDFFFDAALCNSIPTQFKNMLNHPMHIYQYHHTALHVIAVEIS